MRSMKQGEVGKYMAVSLMSLLGGSVNLSAGVGADEPGKVTLTSEGDAAFETIMAASELQEISADQLAAYFGGQANMLNDTQKAQALQLINKLGQMQDGQKLPSDMILTLQEVLPEGMAQVFEQALGEDSKLPGVDSFGELFAQLPKRELTPEELSDIVQKTGLPPVVIFTVLQETPAASPNLAANMVDDMGAAEKLSGYQASLPGLNLPVAPAEAAEAATMESGKAPTVQPSMLKILSQIVDALNQGEEPVQLPLAQNQNMPAMLQPAANDDAKAVAAMMAASLANKQPKGETGKVVDLTHMAATPKQKPAVATPHLAAPQHAANVAAQPAADTEFTPTNTASASAPAAPDALGASSTTTAPTAPDAAAAAAQAPKDQAPLESKFLAQLSQQHRPIPPAEQVLVHVRQAVADGATKVEIKLNPGELGRVEVRIETIAEGNAKIHVTAERKDTLDMLQRDARALERALNEVGVKTDSNSLSFNLRGGDQQQHQQARGDQQQDPNGKQSFASFTEGGDTLDERLNQSEMALTYDAGKAYRLNVDWGVDIRA